MAKIAADPVMARTIAFRARPYGITDLYGVFTAVRKYNLRDVAAQIRTLLLITNPEDEQFWPGQSRELFELLRCPKEIIDFRPEGRRQHAWVISGRLLTFSDVPTTRHHWRADRHFPFEVLAIRTEVN
jgi:hypothetical protein